jgi:hypothetical protein
MKGRGKTSCSPSPTPWSCSERGKIRNNFHGSSLPAAGRGDEAVMKLYLIRHDFPMGEKKELAFFSRDEYSPTERDAEINSA